jgi:hypothetical protein
MLALAVLVGATDALAESPDRAELIQKAQQAKASGDHAEALRLGREAGEAKMTASLRRFLVEEESALGMWVEAYSDAQKCTREAAMEPPSPNHDAVLIGCRTLLHSLRDRVGLLVFDFSSPPPPDLRVTIDGRLVDSLFTETEHPAPLGEVVVEAAANGRATIRRTVRAERAETEPNHVAFAFAEPSPEPLAPSAGGQTGATVVDRPVMRTVRGPSGPILAGIGIAAGIGAIVTYTIANGQYDELHGRCTVQVCPDGHDAQARIERLDTIALVSGIGGAALLGLGATLYFVVDKHVEPVAGPPRRASLSVQIDPRSRIVTWVAPF